MEIQGALLIKPLKNENIVVPLNVMRLIKLNKQKSEMCEALNFSEEQFLGAVQRLVENGHTISKNLIKILCDIETVDFNQLRSNISDDTLRSGLLRDVLLKEIQLNYQRSTEVELNLEFIRLMVTYYKVRDHLNLANIPYFDFDDQSLQNAMQLIVAERSIPNQYHDGNVPPYRSYARFSDLHDFLDIMFPECRRYSGYDYDEYNGWEENEGDSENRSEYNSDRDSDEQNSDDGSDEHDTDDESDNDPDNEPSANCTNSDHSSNEMIPKRHSDSSSEEESSQKRPRL